MVTMVRVTTMKRISFNGEARAIVNLDDGGGVFNGTVEEDLGEKRTERADFGESGECSSG
ncbi:uncharacterized protein DS421_2g56400 [Arachis hypogaea]|nr:uncharacterized protein DS421_2g56400 [Arachis hypogaea]